MDIEKQNPKAKKNGKILEDFNEADLNPNPEGGEDEEEQQQQGGRQEVRCAQQWNWMILTAFINKNNIWKKRAR